MTSHQITTEKTKSSVNGTSTFVSDDNSNDASTSPPTAIPTEARSKGEQIIRWIKTATVFAFMFCGSIILLGIGVTLVHLAILFRIETQEFTPVFISQGFGLMLGAIINALVMRRFACEPLFAFSLVVIAILNAISPWTNSIYGFASCRFFVAMGFGYVDSGSNTYLFYLWADSPMKASIMQAKMFFASIGGLLCPLILSGFLVDLPDTNSDRCKNNDQRSTMLPSTITSLFETVSSVEDQNGYCTATPDDVALVKWSFLLGSVCLIIPILLIATMLRPSTSTRILSQSTNYAIEFAEKVGSSPSAAVTRNPNKMMYMFIGVVTLLACVLMSMFAIISQYLQTFAVIGLHWNVKLGAYLNMAHNGGYVLGRIVGIPLSNFVRPSLFVAGSLVIWTLGVVIMLLTGLEVVPQWALWAGAAISGMGWSSITSSLLVWTNQVTGMLTPVQSAAINVGLSSGFMIGPAITSAVYSIYGHMSMVYVSLVNNSIQYFVFAILLIVAKRLAITGNGDVTSLNFHVFT